MSQFFDSNPGDRSPQGPKRGPWHRGLAPTWRAALGLPDPADRPPASAGDEPASADGAPADPRAGRLVP